MTVHIPILAGPITQALVEPFLKLNDPHLLIDCTFGGGGHTALFLEKLPAPHRVLALDQDPDAVERGRARFSKEISQNRLEIMHTRFGALGDLELDLPVAGLLADLGFSSDQLEDPERGLSFQSEGPLDMRLDPTRGQSAHEYLKQVSEEELARVLFEYAEERFSRRIAQSIVRARSEGELPTTTSQLSSLVVRALPPKSRHGRIHAATRTFQALRIAVNDELGELDSLLEHGILKVKHGGRVAILSFHSLEDRRVKQRFKRDDFQSLSKKPIVADEDEIRANPRSRSAKLRIAERA